MKKSATENGLNGKYIWVKVGQRPLYQATPQIPEVEGGVKKSSTAKRPVERRNGIIALQDSVESILHFKTHSNLEQARVTKEGNLFSRVLHDQDKLKMLYGKGESISKKLLIPTYEGVGSFRRDQTSRNHIPRPQTEGVADSSEGKRTLVSLDDATKILRRKTVLYSEPSYRPTSGAFAIKQLHTDPRQLISFLGDPISYKRSDIVNYEASSVRKKKVQVAAEPERNVNRKERAKGAHRKQRFMDPRGQALRQENWDQDVQDTDSFYNQDLDGELNRREPSEHRMLEHLLDDYAPSFGTKDEKMERESTIRQIEQLTTQSSTASKDYDFTGTSIPSEFANMEVSEGELPPYERIEQGINVRKSKVSRKKNKVHAHKKAVLSSEGHFGEVLVPALAPRSPPWNQATIGWVKTGSEFAHLSTRPRLRKTKRSLYHHRHHHHHWWRPPYLHVRSPQVSPYYDYPDEQENQDYDDIPRLSSFRKFHRYPSAQPWPKFQALSSMAERFVPYPHLPKIREFSPQPLESLEHLPPPPPIPPAIMDREEAGDREAEPVDEWAPFPEPIPEPEPPPIPELAFIKEIPPISEPQEPAPDNLDPKKTFDTGESNGGVKKSSSR